MLLSARPPSLALPRRLLLASVAFMSVAVVVHVAWLLNGQPDWLLRGYFDYPNALFLIGCTVFELILCRRAWRAFQPGAPLRRAWAAMTVAAALHMTGMVGSQILGVDSALNPLHYWHEAALGLTWRPAALAIQGSLYMTVLSVGLWLVDQVYRRAGLAAALRGSDFLLMGLAVLYTGVVLKQVMDAHPRLTLLNVGDWSNNPLLCILLLQAIRLRRSVQRTAGGLIGNCWNAYLIGIFLTLVGSMGLWASAYGHLPYPEGAFTWYVWSSAMAAFTLGPAYQVAAIRMAAERDATDLTLAAGR